jgi:hypothetical protein
MPTIKNKEFDLVMDHYELKSNSTTIEHLETTKTRSFFDLFLELVKKPDPNTRLGDLDEQMLRMDLVGKFQAAIDDEKESVTIDQAPAAFLKKHVVNLNPLVVCQGFIDFQKLIKGWK